MKAVEFFFANQFPEDTIIWLGRTFSLSSGYYQQIHVYILTYLWYISYGCSCVPYAIGGLYHPNTSEIVNALVGSQFQQCTVGPKPQIHQWAALVVLWNRPVLSSLALNYIWVHKKSMSNPQCLKLIPLGPAYSREIQYDFLSLALLPFPRWIFSILVSLLTLLTYFIAHLGLTWFTIYQPFFIASVTVFFLSCSPFMSIPLHTLVPIHAVPYLFPFLWVGSFWSSQSGKNMIWNKCNFKWFQLKKHWLLVRIVEGEWFLLFLVGYNCLFFCFPILIPHFLF